MKKERNIGCKISKYIASGVFLFSLFSFAGCKKETPVDHSKEDELTRQIEELKAQIATAQSLNAELDAQLKAAQELNQQLKALVEQKSTDINTLQAQVAELTASLEELNSQIENLNNQINSLEGDKTTLLEQLKSLEEQKEIAEQTINDLNAQIEELQAQIDNLEKVTITFNSNGGSSVQSLTLAKDSLVNKPTDPTRKGYTFVAWVYGEAETVWNFDTDIANGDITLKAIWTPNTYQITYQLNGGAFTGATPPNSIVYDTNYTLPGVAKANYSLSRWTYNGTTVSSGKWTIASNVTLACEWAKTSATITYVFGYDKPNEVQNVTYNTSYTLQTPERVGYTFLGWKYNGSYISSGTWKYLDSIEVTADWSANTYTLTLDPTEGVLSGSDTINVTFDTSYTLPVCEDLNEKRPFAGWFIGNVRVTNELGECLSPWAIPSDQELEAKYFNPISTKEDFLAISDDITAIYSLVNDIDFEGIEIEPLDNFEGELWGLGYSLKNINFESDSTTIGLFKQINNATFSNIGIQDSTIDVIGVQNSTYYSGLLASQAYGTNTFSNVTTSNISFDVKVDNGSLIAGGLVAIAENLVIEDVSIGGSFEAKSTGNSAYLGGLVGQSVQRIDAERYSLAGSIKSTSMGGTKESLAGGLVASSQTLYLSECTNEGTTWADSIDNESAYAGGLVAKINDRTSIRDCSNESNVVSSKYGGGLIGYNTVASNYLELATSTNNGSVTDNGETGILGGLIGRCKSNTYLSALFNSGLVESTSGHAGGLVGCSDASITFDSCYNEGTVISTNGSAGGFIGLASTTRMQDSYSLGTTSAKVYAGGFVGEATTKVESYKSYVGGEISLISPATDGYVGGFAGRAVNSDMSNCFVFATLKGLDSKTNSYVGKADGCSATNVASAAILLDLSDNSIFDSAYPVVTRISLDTLTAEYIATSLQFDSSKWTIEFDYENHTYPTLKQFEE